MNRLPSILTILACCAFTPSATAQTCPVTVGQIVEPEKPASVYKKLLAANLTKGEFETTEQYEIRKAAVGSSDLAKPIIVEAVYDPKATKYDADTQQLMVFQYAWDNSASGWGEVFDYRGEKYGIKVDSYGPNHGLGLGQTEKTAGSYSASNAYGATTTVTKIERTVYSLFDRPGQKNSTDYKEKPTETWKFDGYADYSSNVGNLPNTGAVFVNIPIALASTTKDSMRTGVYFSPKAPYNATGDKYWAPRINRPRETTATYNVIIGDIMCAVLMDKDGKVLKTIHTAY